jgi:hypothetical protein
MRSGSAKTIPKELMDDHDVSPIVNSAKYDGPDCCGSTMNCCNYASG